MKSKAKRVIYLFYCSVVSVSLVIALYYISKNKNHRNNQFTRLFPSHFLSKPKQFDLTFNSYYIAGVTKTNIFLGNRSLATFIFKSNYDLTDTSHITLRLPTRKKFMYSAIEVIVDSPDIFMMEGITPMVLQGKLNYPFMAENGLRPIRFNAFSIISKSSFALRTYLFNRHENILAKSTLNDSNPHYFPGILTKMGDGVFSLDGSLIKDISTGHLLYVYFYRNEYIEMDTNLNVVSRGKTIDSIRVPEIKLSRVLSDGTITFSAPPLTVNKSCCADSGFLFINSRLRAKNEAEDGFNENSVIDIYSLAKKEYLFSFYVPDDNGVKIKSFQVFNHQLVALYDHTIITYSMLF